MNDKEEMDRHEKVVRYKMVSEEDEKQRQRERTGVRSYHNRFTTEPNQFPFLTSTGPADD